MIDGINYNGVCRAAPGLAQVCFLDEVALLIADSLPADSIFLHSRMFRQDRNLCLDWNSLFAKCGKTP